MSAYPALRNRTSVQPGRWVLNIRMNQAVVRRMLADPPVSVASQPTIERWLETQVIERTRRLEEERTETLRLLAVAAEYRDDDTFRHTERVGIMAAEIGARLELGPEQVRLLREAAPLHDVGKIAIPDSILLKPDKLTAEEHETMKTHAAHGARLMCGSSSPVLRMAAEIAATHHEWWDGSGYPCGLAGERIPLVGRIVAVADVFDALTHDRPYKAAWPVAQSIARIERAAGSQFDPRMVDAFLRCHLQVDSRPAAEPGRGPSLRLAN
jgi:putative two-component system response regulator